MNIELPELPYELNALEPYLSQEALEYHYGKHHSTYVKNLNDLLTNENIQYQSLETIIKQANGAIFNNAAQIWNHNFYWNCLTPNNKAFPQGGLLNAIDKYFTNFDQFKSQFTKIALSTFGSGWVWLVKNNNGDLEILSTSNANNPLQDNQVPLLTCDVWEHAYYIDYRNNRAKYLEAFWHIVNWDFVASIK